MSSFAFYGSSQTSLVQTLVNPPKLSSEDDRSLEIPDKLKTNLAAEFLQKIQGILDCERIPLDGRVVFLRRVVTDYTKNPERFFGQMGVMGYIQAQTLNQLFLNHIKKEYKFYHTSPNGSCGFEALIMPFQDVGWDVPKLRAAIGKFTRNNLAKLKTRNEAQGGFADIFELQTKDKKGVVKIDDAKIEKYIKKVETPAAISDGWLSIREIAIYVHCMHKADINVVVNVHSHFYYRDNGEYTPEVYNKNLRGDLYAGDKDPIYINLYWNGSAHYDYLDKIEKPAKQGDAIDMVDDSKVAQKESSSSTTTTVVDDDVTGMSDSD